MKVLEMTSEPGARFYPFIEQDEEIGLSGYLSVFDGDGSIGVNLSLYQLTPDGAERLRDGLQAALNRLKRTATTQDAPQP